MELPQGLLMSRANYVIEAVFQKRRNHCIGHGLSTPTKQLPDKGMLNPTADVSSQQKPPCDLDCKQKE